MVVMKIPEKCEIWEKAMDGGEENSRRVLANIRAENCLDEKVTEIFFDRIARSRPPASAREALAACSLAVHGDPANGVDDLYCRAGEVPTNRFVHLFKMVTGGTCWFLDAEYSDESGISRSDLQEGDADLVRDFVDGYDRDEGWIGKSGGIAWVAEGPAPPEEATSLADRLGLPHIKEAIEDQKIAVLIEFRRSDLKEKLHVPRTTDGIDHPAFRPVRDCDLPHGWTEPMGEGTGIPEAVHRSCKVRRIGIVCM